MNRCCLTFSWFFPNYSENTNGNQKTTKTRSNILLGKTLHLKIEVKYQVGKLFGGGKKHHIIRPMRSSLRPESKKTTATHTVLPNSAQTIPKEYLLDYLWSKFENDYSLGTRAYV